MNGRYASFLPAEVVAQLNSRIQKNVASALNAAGRGETACGSFRFASSQPQARQVEFTVLWIAPVRGIRPRV